MKSGADSLKNSTKLMNLYQDSSRKKRKKDTNQKQKGEVIMTPQSYKGF